jgi:hypothetical protein
MGRRRKTAKMETTDRKTGAKREAIPNAESYSESDPTCLDSWKAIADYLNRNVRTVQRWEQIEGMPVHRQIHRKGGSVYAYQQEIDAWQRGRSCLQRLGGQNQLSALSRLAIDPMAQPERSLLRKLLLALLDQLTAQMAGSLESSVDDDTLEGHAVLANPSSGRGTVG